MPVVVAITFSLSKGLEGRIGTVGLNSRDI
jgi:hypothetical protein